MFSKEGEKGTESIISTKVEEPFTTEENQPLKVLKMVKVQEWEIFIQN